MPTPFAYLVLYTWPIVAVILFRRMEPRAALIWTIVAGYLLMPQGIGFDLPLLPAVEKNFIAATMAAILVAKEVHKRLLATRNFKTEDDDTEEAHLRVADADTHYQFEARRGNLLFWGLLAMAYGGALLTVLTNGDAVREGLRYIPGLRLYDLASIWISMTVMLLPFLLARRYLATPESHVLLLKILVIAGLGYSVLILYELRMSPRLNRTLYGYANHDWAMHVRGGSYRPMVFLNHGIWVATFVALTVLAGFALWREKITQADGWKWLAAGVYLLLVLSICKSLGGLIIALIMLPGFIFLGVRGQLLLAAVVAGTVLLYPTLRGADMIPVDRVTTWAATVDPARAQSFEFRLRNEDILLDRANRKPLAGWGSWGRPRVSSGEKGGSTADGYWIIVIGVYGWIGYIAQFGMFGLPIILMAWGRRSLAITPATSGLAIVMAAGLIDLIPNATMTPLTWIIAGALMGRYQTAHAPDPQPAGGSFRAAKAAHVRSVPPPRRGTPDGFPGRQANVASSRSATAQNAPVHHRKPREARG